jgi:glycosyltransferase involved in cell wall biosynthesis
MAQKVVELAGNPDLRKEMGLKGRKRVESLFSFEKIQEEIRDLLSCTNGY